MLLTKKIPLLIFLLGTIGCKKTDAPPPPQVSSFYTTTVTADDRKTITAEEAKTYHIDTKRKYKYRTGNPGHYEYNYNVKGINIKGDSVFGNINTNGKYGAGILEFDSIEDLEIKTEWVGYGKLKATDNQGNEYEMVVK